MANITVVAMGNKMPDWVEAASQTYIKRLKEYVQFQCIEIPLMKRTHALQQASVLEKEAAKILQTCRRSTYWIALDVKGQAHSSKQMAKQLQHYTQINHNIGFIIGGPEGLHPDVLEFCKEKWSLSQLTLPHPLVRVILLESLYRAWTILNHHPYHK